MFEQILESFRRVSESSLQAQQDMWKNWAQPWAGMPSMPSFPGMPGMQGAAAAAPGGEWARSLQKRWLELIVAALHKHREALDTVYRAGIQALEETFRASDGRSPEDYRKTAEELWRKLFETFRTQYETQLQELQKFTTLSFDMAHQQG